MLQTFREYSGSIFVKILFGVLVASFALWGVGDVFRNYTSMRPLATIGDGSVSQEEFLRAYQRQINELQNISRGKLDAETIKKLQVPQSVLDTLINNATITNQVKSLGLLTSDAAVRDRIQSMPEFQNKEGRFDKQRFDQILSSVGLTEGALVQDMRNNILKIQLIGGVSFGLSLPSFYVEALHRGLEEKRIFNVVQVPTSAIKISEMPTDADLEQLYNQNQDAFTRPETRQISLLTLDPKIMQSKITISAEQLQQEYENRKKELASPEKRDVIQLTFSKREDAQKALELLRSGQTPHQVITRGTGDMKAFDEAGRDQFTEGHAKVIFGLNVGDYSDPIDSALGWSLFGVKKIVPARERAFSEVKAQLEESLKAQALNDKLYDIKNKIEDAVAGGANLSDVAKEFSLTLENYDPMTLSGSTLEGKSVLPVKMKEQVLDQAFSLPEGGDSPMIDVSEEGKSFIVHLHKVIPQAVPPFTEIKELVSRVWRESKQQAKAAELAQAIAKEAKSLEQLTILAKKNSLVVKVMPALSRSDLEGMKKPEQEVAPAALARGFSLPKNEAGVAANIDGFVVLMLNKVLPLDQAKDAEKKAQLNESLAVMMNRDFSKLYISHQRDVQKVSINQSILDNLMSRSS